MIWSLKTPRISRVTRICTGWLLLLLNAGGCGFGDRLFEPREEGTIVAEIGGRSYSRLDLERFFDSRLSEFRDPADADRIKSNLLEAFVEERLILSEAERRNIQPAEESVRSMLDRISANSAEAMERRDGRRDAELERGVRESLRMQKYLHDFLLKDVGATEAECQAYYREHLGDFVVNDVVRVREILVDTPEQAERIHASLQDKRNKNFAELARVYSKAASASDGGDLGSFQRGELPQEFEKTIFALSPGSVSKVVQTGYGYHIFLVEEKILAHQQKFYEVKDQIQEKLTLERERAIIEKEIALLQRKTPVSIRREKLGFNYIGARFSAP
jgi:parvulin-like peptidyl-prolyl isomerase